MATTPKSQIALAHDPVFLNRLQYLICQQAITVKNEASTTTGHAARAAFAGQVLADPAAKAVTMAVTICGGINLVAATTAIDFDRVVTTDATDAVILSQIATFWDAFAGVL